MDVLLSSMSGPAKQTQYSLSNVLGLFQDREGYEPWTTREVADRIGSTRRTALTKLTELENRGEISSKSIGKNGRGGRVWWRSTEARSQSGPVDTETLEAKIRELELPGDEEKVRRRRKAVKRAYEYLRETEKAMASEIAEVVYEQDDAGFGSPDTLWRKCLRPALKDLGLETPDRGKPWRFVNQDSEQAGLTQYR